MWSFLSGMLGSRSAAAGALRRAEKQMCAAVAERSRERVFSIAYGSIDVDPGLVSLWICVQTDDEKARFSGDDAFVASLREMLVGAGYPEEGARRVFVGFESQETVDRESSGDWWGHFR